jgi:hypothetical protein
MLRSLAILVPSLSLLGCAAQTDSDGAMIVLQNTALAQGAVSCLFTGVPGQPTISHGQISTASPIPYLLEPLIESRVTAVAGEELQKTILVEGADVHLSIPTVTVTNSSNQTTTPTVTLTGADAAFQSLFSGSIMPNGGATNVGMDLIPTTVLNQIVQQSGATGSDHLHAEVVAQINVFGSLGGDKVKALPFQYAVTVCNDCVVNVLGDCPAVGTIRPGNPCNEFQDFPVDCCTEPTSGALTCPARTQ